MRLILAALLLAACARTQLPPITWRYTEDLIPTCPSAMGQPVFDDPHGFNFFLSDPVSGAITMQWRNFPPYAAVMLVMSTDMSRTYFPPCMLVPPDVWLVSSVSNIWGQCRFSFTVATQAPLSVVPLGVNLMAIGQVVEMAAPPLYPIGSSSYVFNIEALR